MTIKTGGYVLDRVAIVDDEPFSRETYGYTVENADLTPVPQEGPLGTLDDFTTAGMREQADAVLCDFKLGVKKYANFSGAELVARSYRDGLPSLLCTRWETAELFKILPYRRWIPALITPAELNEESLILGLEECIYELTGRFTVARRPWRTQVHFLQHDEDYPNAVFAELPAWDIGEVVKIDTSKLPATMSNRSLEDYRCHAQANLAAGSVDNLYICDWEHNV